jgi:hypothetical protein
MKPITAWALPMVGRPAKGRFIVAEKILRR